MPSELLKTAVWGSIWTPQGGLGTLEQIHPPVFPPGVSPRLATNRTGAGTSELTVRDSDDANLDDRGTQGTIALAPSAITTP